MSDFLFGKVSVMESIGSILDLSGSIPEYNQSATGEEADTRAIYNDFAAVGADILYAASMVTEKK